MDISISLVEGGKMPTRATKQSSGFDCFARLEKGVIISKGQVALIPLGFKIELPMFAEAQIRPRSGLALKSGITCLNTPGTVDADYRGEVSAILYNAGQNDFLVLPNARICQMVIMKLPDVDLYKVTELSETERGTGGFGSTGV